MSKSVGQKGDKFTPWFSGRVRPVRPGVYQRGVGGTAAWYAYWSPGKGWCKGHVTVERALVERRPSDMLMDWRGLAKKPEGAA